VAAYLRDLPALETLEEYRPSLVTTLYADDDQPFASLFEQRRILMPLAQVPVRLQQALLAVEDAQFYEHRGVNPRAIARAMWSNLRALHTVEGASTITQQVAKNMLLSNELSIARKVREILLATRIDRAPPTRVTSPSCRARRTTTRRRCKRWSGPVPLPRRAPTCWCGRVSRWCGIWRSPGR